MPRLHPTGADDVVDGGWVPFPACCNLPNSGQSKISAVRSKSNLVRGGAMAHAFLINSGILTHVRSLVVGRGYFLSEIRPNSSVPALNVDWEFRCRLMT